MCLLSNILLTMGEQECRICNSKNNCSRCTNCRKVWYCSKQHQKQDWKRHKEEECFPGVVSVSAEFGGRYLTATRDISEGELVLKDSVPLFSAPNGKEGAFLLCLACYSPIEGEDLCPCPHCKWPLHKKCLGNKYHEENECSIFTKWGITLSSTKEENLYDKILVLRGCLLKKNDPKKWILLELLEDHSKSREETEEGKILSLSMKNFILENCHLKDEDLLTAQDVDHVVGVVVVNAYVTEDNLSSSPDFKSGSYIYNNGSMPAHCCSPNCKWTIDSKGELKLWALVTIKEGESLSHCYTYGGGGTLERQRHLRKTKFFTCQCPRCKDSTELCSFFSGVKCKCGGYFTSEDPLKMGSKWKCNSCPEEIQERAVDRLVQEMREGHTKISNSTPSHTPHWKECLINLENHLINTLQEKVHPNHFLCQEVEQDILLRISYILNNNNLEVTQRSHYAQTLVSLSRKCLSLLDKIAPGMTTHCGRQLYYLQQGLGILIMEKIDKPQDNNKDLKNSIQEWKKVRSRGSLILKTESKAREEFVLGQAMLDNEEAK